MRTTRDRGHRATGPVLTGGRRRTRTAVRGTPGNRTTGTAARTTGNLATGAAVRTTRDRGRRIRPSRLGLGAV
ncbi:hypothetical protein, partial [Streptomyces harbinensis]|uniref:hypothetical protein n=1 Tax=Streptomyces harbinensis TaxID=1176198 RepID=UPI0034E04F71